jgi:hypothetical protein
MLCSSSRCLHIWHDYGSRMLDSFFLVKESKKGNIQTPSSEQHFFFHLHPPQVTGNRDSGPRKLASLGRLETSVRRLGVSETQVASHATATAPRAVSRETPGPRRIWRKPAALARRIGGRGSGARGATRLVSRAPGGRRNQTVAVPTGWALSRLPINPGHRATPHAAHPHPSKLGKPNGYPAAALSEH